MSDTPDKDALPLYGCMTGILLPVESFELATGIELRKAYFDIFDSPMMAFKAPPPNQAHPAPWVAIRGGFNYECRAELAIENLSAFDGFSASQAAWLRAEQQASSDRLIPRQFRTMSASLRNRPNCAAQRNDAMCHKQTSRL